MPGKKNGHWFLIIHLIGCVFICNGCKKANNRPIITDIDGNVYHTITIGTQVWMLENLKTTKYRNGDPLPNVTDGEVWTKLISGAYCDYNNNPNNSESYGRLYNWRAIADSRNIAPQGWHVATDAEWITLVTYLGESIDPLTGYYMGDGGAKLKEKGTKHWDEPNMGATNETGFTALPGGYRYLDGFFYDLRKNGAWWSSTPTKTNPTVGMFWFMSFNLTEAHSAATKINGYSVRCIKD